MLKKASFQCQESCGGKCCTYPDENSFVFLTPEDVKKIADATGMKPEDFCLIDEFTNTRFKKRDVEVIYLKRSKDEKTCMFIKDGKCSIYESRPIQCRTFPFWRDYMSPREWKKLGEYCPGVGKGKELNYKEIREKLREQDAADKEY